MSRPETRSETSLLFWLSLNLATVFIAMLDLAQTTDRIWRLIFSLILIFAIIRAVTYAYRLLRR